MKLSQIARLAGVALLVMIANVAMSILYMVAYGYLINPGHDQAYYNHHIQNAGPYCSIIAGIPLMLLAGWWVTGWRWEQSPGVKAIFIVWLVYTLVDLSVLLAAGMTTTVGLLFAVSFATKLAAGYIGAQRRLQQTKEIA